MKRLIYILLSLAVVFTPLYAGAAYSTRLGNIAVDIKEGSDESIIYKAVREEYSDRWLDEYTSSSLSFALAYSSAFSPLLPLSNFLLSVSVDGRVKVLDQKSGTLLTFVLKEGRITALDIEN